MKKIIVGLAILIVAFFIISAGCAQQKSTETKTTTAGPAKTAEPVVPLDTGADDISQIESDINTSDLDDVEKDIEEINW